MTCAVSLYIYRNIERNAQHDFEQMSERITETVHQRFQKPVYGMNGARAYIYGVEQLTREGFHRHVTSRDLQNEFPGVRGIGFIEYVPRPRLDAFLAQARADGAPDFALRQLEDKNHDDLFVIKYIYPAEPNKGARGLDVGSEKTRRTAAVLAMESGETAITGPITLVQDAHKTTGALIFSPIYTPGADLSTVEKRRQAFIGFTYAPVVIKELLDNIPDVQSGLVDFELFDHPINAPTQGQQPIFDADNHIAAHAAKGLSAEAGRRYAVHKALQLPNRNLTLTMYSTHRFETTVDRHSYWLALLAGTLISALLAFVFHLQIRSRSRAEQLAEKMTADLRLAQRDNEGLLLTLQSHAIVSMTNGNGTIHFVNDAFCDISGYSREELIGQNHRIVKSHVQDEAFWRTVWSEISSGKPWRGVICNRNKNGQLYWVDTFIAPFLDTNGLPEKYISIRTDITAAKKAEEALRWNESLLNLMALSSPLGFLVVDNQTDEILYFNQRFCEIWGIEALIPQMQRKELKNNDIIPYCIPMLTDVPAFARSCEPLQDMNNRVVLEDEIAFINHRTVRRFTTQIRDANDTYFGRFYIFEDISKQKNVERTLEQARLAAEAAAASKAQFLANMSHEIRTPMNAILGLLNLLQSTELTARQRDYTSKTEGAAQSLLGLLNDILDFSKVDAGKMQLEHLPFRMDSLLRNLSVVLSANVGNKPVEILYDVDTALPEVVVGDALRLQQILINLGGNAVKFTPAGQVVIALRQQRSSSEAVSITFSVQDSGIGIAPEHQTQIFSGFTQAEASTTRRFGGTGLGLAISQRLVKLMGGDIQLQSTLGQGTTFSFTLTFPISQTVPQELQIPPRVNGQSHRVLVVDDNPVACQLLIKMTQSWGWTCDPVSSGQQALDTIQAQYTGDPQQDFPYSVVLMNWQMPDQDGWSTTQRIRALTRHTQRNQPLVIMLSDNGNQSLASRSADEQNAINAFIVKPVTASMLFDAVRDAQAGNAHMQALTAGRSNQRVLTGMRILVVEDNLINQQVAEELLSGAGAQVSLAANGQLGVEAVQSAHPPFDVVLMDVQMPVMDGYTATGVIRQQLQMHDLPIIAMTANAMPSDREACLQAGMNEHIGKPFVMGELTALLLRITGYQAPATTSSEPPAPSAAQAQVDPLAGLELEAALQRIGGMRDLYVRTARDFIRLAPGMLNDLHQHARAHDKKATVMDLHSMKSNAALLGLTALQAQTGMLEKQCQAGESFSNCEQALAPLEGLIAEAQALLEKAIATLQ